MNFSVLVFPQRNYMFKQIFDKATPKLCKRIDNRFKDMNFDFFPLLEGFFSLEYKDMWKETFFTKENFGISLAAESLKKLEIIYGAFSHFIVAETESAKTLLRILTSNEEFNRATQNLVNEGVGMRSTNSFGDNPQSIMKSGYETLIIMDRQQDMITPFLTEFSYYGLVDEIFQMKFNRIFIEEYRVILDKEKPEESTQCNKNSTVPSKICPDIQCKECPSRVWFDLGVIFDVPPKEKNISFENWKSFNIRKVNSQIKEILKTLSEMEVKQKNMDSSMDSIDYKLKFLDLKKYIIAHTSLATIINSALNDPLYQYSMKLSQRIAFDFEEKLLDKIISMIEVEEPLYKIFSLVILASFANSGLKSIFLETLHDKIFDSFGFEGIELLLKLKKGGLILIRDYSLKDRTNPEDIGQFYFNKEKLNLFDYNVDVMNDDSFHSGYSGYMSMLVKNFESLFNPDYKSQSRSSFSSYKFSNSNFFIY